MLLCVMYQGMPSPLTPSSTSKWKSWNFTLAATNFAISADSESFVFLKHLFTSKAGIKNENINNKFRTSCGFFQMRIFFCIFWFFYSSFPAWYCERQLSDQVPVLSIYFHICSHHYHVWVSDAYSAQAGLNLANGWAFIDIWVYI